MANNLVNLNIQYENYANWYLKLYVPDTNNALAMYSDAIQTSSFDKLVLDINGFPSSAGTPIIPFSVSYYDAYLFPTEYDANKNITTNAIKIASNVTAEKLLSSDVVKATETDLGTVTIANTTDVTDYVIDLADGALNSTEPDLAKVMNIQRVYQMIQEASAGGSSADIGDIFIKDVSVGDADADLIKLDGSIYDETIFTDLALFDDYKLGENIASVDAETLINVRVATEANEGNKLVKISDTIYYGLNAGLNTSSSRAGFYKSIDSGTTWIEIVGSNGLSQTNSSNTALVFNGSDKIFVVADERIFVYDITTDTFDSASGGILFNDLNQTVIDAHYNTNLSKLIIICDQIITPALGKGIEIFSTVDGVSINLENEFAISNASGTIMLGSTPSSNLNGLGGLSYKNGFYLIVNGKGKNIYRINEVNFEEEIIFDYSGLVEVSSFDTVAAPAITNDGKIAVIVAGDRYKGFDIAYSATGNKDDWNIINYAPSNLFVGANSELSYPFKDSKITPLSGESFMLSDSNAMYISITNDFFKSELYTYIFDITSNVANISSIYNESIDSILIDLPALLVGNTHKELKLDITLNTIYKTPDLTDKAPTNNSMYYVQGK